MTTRSLQLAALFTASLSLVPAGLFADGAGQSREKWQGYITMGGQRVAISLSFENATSGAIIGDIEMPGQVIPRGTLENVSIVGNDLSFAIAGIPGSGFKGSIASDGLSVKGTYTLGGNQHPFEVTYVEAPATDAKPADASMQGSVTFTGAPNQGSIEGGEHWAGAIDIPGDDVSVELTFVNNTDGTIAGRLNIPSQNVSGIAVSDFAINGYDLSFGVPNVDGSPVFQGSIAEDGETVKGLFTQHGKAFPFSLAYVKSGVPTAAVSTTSAVPAPAGSPTPGASGNQSQSYVQGDGPERWEGTAMIHGKPTALLLDFVGQESGGITGRAILPTMNGWTVDFNDVRIQNETITFTLPAVGGHSAAFVRAQIQPDGETVRGGFVFEGVSHPIELRYIKNPQLIEVAAQKYLGSQPVTALPPAPAPVNAIANSSVSVSGTTTEVPGGAVATEQNADAERWDGVIQLPGQELKIDLDFTAGTDGSIIGDISIPAQNAKDIPLNNITINDHEVKASITGVPGNPTFDGKIVGDGTRVEGKFHQSGMVFPFHWDYVKNPGQAAAATLDGFAQWADQARKDWRAPGLAIAVIKDGRVVFSEGLGTRSLDSNEPVTSDTLFAIGSCTKAITTFVLGTLVDEGKVSWDEPVRTYIPTLKLKDAYATDNITLRDMVTHRSGLPRHDMLWYNNNDISRAGIVERLAELEPNRPLRQTWQYNNLMYVTAGYVTEVVTHNSWEEVVRSRVLNPLGMASTNFSVRDSQSSPNFASPYEYRDGAMRKMPFRDISLVGPAGSVNSSLNDMVKWAKVNLTGLSAGGAKIISSTTLEDLHRPQMVLDSQSQESEVITIGYAMGWFVHSYRGRVMVEHGGNIDGFTAAVTLLPKDNIAVVAMTNMNHSPLPQLATYHALDRVLGGEVKDWSGKALQQRDAAEALAKQGKENRELARKQGTTPSRPLADFAGEYYNPGYGVVTIAENGALSATFNGIVTNLTHWHYDVFSFVKNETDPTFEGKLLNFRSGSTGEVDSLEISLDPLVPAAIFTRRASGKMMDVNYLSGFAGEFEMGGQVVTFSMRGDTLIAQTAGQPIYDLVAIGDDTFALKGLTGYTVKFTRDGSGASAATFSQPNGNFPMKRK